MLLLFAPFENSKWSPAEVKVCIETLWGNNIFIFFLRTAEQNLTKLGRDVSCEVLKSCPGLY